jgi:hypothetical protein
MSIPKIKIRKFNPDILETRRLHGSPPTIVVIGKRGCMIRDTPIIMFDGQIKMIQDIKIGDKLMGDDSQPRTVLSLCRGNDKMYKIKQKVGMDYTVNEQHILSLKVTSMGLMGLMSLISPNALTKENVLDIKVCDYLKLSNNQKSTLKGFKVPIVFPAKDLPVDPYITGCFDNKYIPEIYKYNSRENQLKLLAGILDTDGSHDPKTGCYNITKTNKVLSEDIQYVARCLGFIANIEECKKSYNLDGTVVNETYYRQSISGIGLEDIPTRRIQTNSYTDATDATGVTDITIEPLGEGTYYGFQIDGNQRFLLGDCTVTHNSGKSTLIADLMWHMRRIPMFICMSGTEEGNGFYGKHMHPLLIHGEYKKEIVSNLIKQQKDKLKKCIKAGIEPNSRPDLGTGLLLDDCGFNKKIMNQEDMRLLFMNGRHWKICFIVSLQYMMGIPPDLRTNIDFVFCLRENIAANQKRLYDNFFGCFKKFVHFREAFEECTNNYECLVLDNTSKSTKVEDCVFYYKATPNRDYKLGSRDLWNYLDSRYKEDGDSDTEDGEKMPTSVVIKKAPMVKIIEKV